MKNIRARVLIILLRALFCALALAAVTSCSEPGFGGRGTITLAFPGSGAARGAIDPRHSDPDVAAASLAQIQHRVTAAGAAGVFTHTFEKGATIGRITVPEGLYSIKVEAYYEGILLCTGASEKPVEVKSGKTSSAPVTMGEYVANIYEVNDDYDWMLSPQYLKENDIPNIAIIKSDITNAYPFTPVSTGEIIIIGNNKTLTSSGSSSLINVNSGSVTIKDLHLVGGAYSAPLVTISGGTFVMAGNSSVSGNGGGGVSLVSGAFTMQDNASVSKNTNNVDGGGVYMTGGTFTMNGSASVSGNTGGLFGGGVYVDGGAFTMNNSASVSGNDADYGGGVYVSGTFTMQGGASVHSNSGGEGGGVYVDTGTFTMKGSSRVYQNTSEYSGGGVTIDGSSIFTMEDASSVYGNKAVSGTNDGEGGGVYIDTGTFIMKGSSSVYQNISDLNGGGITVYAGGKFTMDDTSSVYGNSSPLGGGVYITALNSASISTFTMKGSSKVYGNKAVDNGDGGGVFVDVFGAFQIESGTVTGAGGYGGLSANTTEGDGAALYLIGGTASWGAGAGTSLGTAPYYIDQTITGTGVKP